ncbi:MAG: DUF1707 and DUF2154 domain-containing protein [Gemmatimonadetes bacterium]|nr:DUF1707 and DUF2154 domain-containing protein [Gemmatimonadota bacterium]NNM32323.1 DUF1707 and DUF2154 domain-containing protein [Gemmatimonadota bacterium]
MTDDQDKALPPATGLRNQVIDSLTELFASDGLTLEEFESRIDQAHRATTVMELRALLPTTLGPKPAVVAAAPPPARRAADGTVRSRSLAFGFWGGTQRSGTWTPARRNYAVAFQGGVELDLREARFGPGVTDIWIFCAMGGVNVIVPPDLQVDFGGVGIMGGFDAEAGARAFEDPDGPVVRIRGVAIWGGAAVEIRQPGESATEARQRRRITRRAKKQLGPAE